MKKYLLYSRTLFSYLVMGIVLLLIIIPCFIIACLPARWRHQNVLYYYLIGFLYKAVVWAVLVPVTVRGKENMRMPAVIIANHQSALDIPFLGILLNSYHHIWLFLARYSRVPILGFIARRMNIMVDTSCARKMVASIDKGLEVVRNHACNIIIFPEGGRYNDGTIHRFFSGFAKIAQKTDYPVIPVFMKNVGRVYPPRSFLIHDYPVTIVVGPPFFCTKDEGEAAFIERVRAWFVQQNSE